MNIISIINNKGGVGKTTITQNLGVCMAKNGYKTAIIDFDAIDSLEVVKLFRNDEIIRNKKIIGVYTSDNNINRNEIFETGCDSLMSKSEFEKACNNILMF